MSVFTITIEQRRAQTDENMTCSFSRSNAGPTGPSSTRWCNRSRDTAWMCQEHYDQVAKNHTFPGMGNWGPKSQG